jgi:cytochrome c5
VRLIAAVRLGAVLLICSGSASARPVPPAAASGAAQSEDLPDGDGKKVLQASCTGCHDLTEVTKFKGYYTRDDWRDIVTTMIEYGATVKKTDVDILIDYLTKTLGKKPD